MIELVERGRDIGQHRQALLGDLGKAAKHNDLFVLRSGGDSQDARPQRGDHRRMSRKHAEIALGAGNIDLIDFSGEGEFFRRDEIEVKGGHGVVLRMASGEWRVVKKGNGFELFATPYS